MAQLRLLSTKRFASDLDYQNLKVGEENFMIGSVSCVELSSALRRDVLVLTSPPNAPDTHFRLINVHLDSIEKLSYRNQQLEILVKVLREPGCSMGATLPPSAPGMTTTRSDRWMFGSHRIVGAQTLMRIREVLVGNGRLG